MAKTFQVTLVKSTIGTSATQRRTVKALGLTRRTATVTLADNAANRGQISKVQHLVEVKVQR